MIYSDPEVLKKEVDRQLRAIRRRSKIVGATKKSAMAFLIRAGICSKNGRLSPRYR
jgi:hypothetical protein